MLVKEILESLSEFPVVATDDKVSKAARLMRDHDVRAVSVVENRRLLGIVTDWDVVDALVERGSELPELPVSAIMTGTELHTITADATVADAMTKLARHRVHHLPVLDDEGCYVGTICLGLEWSEEDMLTPPMRPTLTARRP